MTQELVANPAAAARGPYIPYADGCYRSPELRPGLLPQCFPSACFYARYLRLVLCSGLRAGRGLYDGHAWAEGSRQVREALERVGVRFEVTGMEHLAAMEQPFVVAANHMSALETMVLPSILMTFRETTFIVKQSLLKYPLFRNILGSREPIAVTQTNPREDFKIVMREGPLRLQNGYALIVFPEAARRAAFDPANFNSMAEKVAARANVPLIPLALKTDAWGMGWPLRDFGRIDPGKTVHFAFGPPLRFSARDADRHGEILTFITEKLAAWTAAAEPVPTARGGRERGGRRDDVS
jgi:1-acyl-sn-glycerol-3-phosphate acyltransferase